MSFNARRSLNPTLSTGVAILIDVPTFVDVAQSEFSPIPLDSHAELRNMNGTAFFKWGTTTVTAVNYDFVVNNLANKLVVTIPEGVSQMSVMSQGGAPSTIINFGRDIHK